MSAPTDPRAATERIVGFYESLSPAALDRLGEFYTDDARFKDPFNEVRGVAAIRGVFEHMYASLHEPRFVVTQRVVDGAQCFLVWEFRFRFRRFDTRTAQVVRGGSHLVLAADGRIADHRDYWDAAEELYEKLPAVGALMRWLKRRANR
ncbi:MAG: nuclear transport factor 2 family protein [Hydrogenophaga sp.]|nr:nuclear transport factor 2 family protein [Hydrogenophaga sp.]